MYVRAFALCSGEVHHRRNLRRYPPAVPRGSACCGKGVYPAGSTFEHGRVEEQGLGRILHRYVRIKVHVLFSVMFFYLGGVSRSSIDTGGSLVLPLVTIRASCVVNLRISTNGKNRKGKKRTVCSSCRLLCCTKITFVLGEGDNILRAKKITKTSVPLFLLAGLVHFFLFQWENEQHASVHVFDSYITSYVPTRKSLRELLLPENDLPPTKSVIFPTA